MGTNTFLSKYLFAAFVSVLTALASTGVSAQKRDLPSSVELQRRSQQNLQKRAIEETMLPLAERAFGLAGRWRGGEFGKDAAKALAFDSMLKIRAARMPSDTDFVPALMYYNLSKKRLDRKRIHREFYSLGFLQSYQQGTADGKIRAFSGFTTALSVLESDLVRKPFAERPLLFDYDGLAALLCKGGGQVLSRPCFDVVLGLFNQQILEYLNRNFAPELRYEEQQAALAFYAQHLHKQECDFLYPFYLEEYARCRRLQGAPFFNNDCYLNASVFFQLATVYVGAVCDAALSYGKGHTEYATHRSFRVMGEMGELLVERVLPVLQVHLFNNSLLYQYDFALDGLRQNVRDLLDSMVIDTRTELRHAIRELGSGNAHFIGQVEVKTIAQLGLRTDSIRLCFDHERRLLKVFVPQTPKLLKVLHEDHKLMGGTLIYEAPCFIKEIIHGKKLRASNSVTDSDLNAVKDDKTQNPVEQRMFCRRPFHTGDKRVFVPTLKNALEPMLAALPHSLYRVVLVFGGAASVVW